MVLGKLPVLVRPTNLVKVGQGPIALAVDAVGVGLHILFFFSRLSFLHFLLLSLSESLL